MKVGTVAEIWRYPVKSMGGERLDSTSITAEGVEADRRFALRDVETGKIVSAKRPARWGQLLDFDAVIRDGTVELTSPSGESITLDDPDAVAWLSKAVGREVELAAGSPAGELYGSEWPEIDGLVLAGDIDLPVAMSTESPSFVDLATLHVLTTSSLRALDEWVGESVSDVRRFRPSILIDTGEAAGLPEEDWQGSVVRIGDDLEIKIGDRTPRCVMPTIGQRELDRRPDVLQQIAANNRHDMGGFGDFACLGMYADVETEGRINVGDSVDLLTP